VNVRDLVESWQETITVDERGETFVCLDVVVDDDDPTLDEYQLIDLPKFAQLTVGPRLRLGGSLNAAAPRWAIGVAASVGFMGDDHRPRTIGWDRRIAETLDRRKLGVVYGNDLIQGPLLPTAVFMDSRIVRTLGWMVYPGMTHLWFDNLWRKLGEELGTLTYLDDVVIEHCHPIAGKAEWDQGYTECNGGDVWAHDEQLYNEWVGQHMADDVARLKAVI